MAEKREQRRLAAILVADVVGYSRLMEADETGTLSALRERRKSILEPVVKEHGGRVVKVMGDGVLVEFASAVNSVKAAVELQERFAKANESLPDRRRILLRIGINLGDVIGEGSDIFGDGVNLASRLETLADPGSICISGKVYEEVIGKLRVSYQDLGEQAVKNIDRPVRVYRLSSNASGEETAPARPAFNLPDKPSIAVLPFQNMSGDPEQDYFADGMVEEIITALSRMRWLFVIARNTTFTYKGRSVDVRQVARELGVRYVLEGSVRRANDKVRIVGQLIDTATGSHIWADRYEGGLSDVFDLQDRIAESVVGAIQPSILTAEMQRSARKRPESLVAYDYVLRALPLVWSHNKSESENAQILLERALSIEPAYPLALSLAAWCHAQRVVYNWTEALELERSTALRLAQQAAAISRDDPMVLAILAAAHTIVGDFRIAAEHLERALSLDPNSAWAWRRNGWLNLHRGRPELAIQQFERSIRLSPFDLAGYASLFGISCAHFLQGRYEESIEWSQRGLSQQPDAVWHLRVHVPALVHAGRKDEAQKAFAKMMEHYPGLTIGKVRDALQFPTTMMDRIADGLGQAGLPP